MLQIRGRSSCWKLIFYTIITMNKNKLIYAAPEAELLVVRYEKALLIGTVSSKGTELMTVDSEEDF